MEIIVAVDENYGIGKDGDLLAHLSPDLKRLKAMTVGNIIVMGSKTYMSFPKRPLPDRENLIITHHPENYPGIKCLPVWMSFWSIRKRRISRYSCLAEGAYMNSFCLIAKRRI